MMAHGAVHVQWLWTRSLWIHPTGSPGRCQTGPHLWRETPHPMAPPRFLTLDDVAETLNVSWSQAYALVRRKELIAIQIGGRGQWRVERDELERFIQQKYAEARGTTPPPVESMAGPEGATTSD